jgi:acyl-CoA hydrolase
MQMAAHSHTAFEGTLCFGWIFRQMDEKGIPSSLDKAYT